VDIRYFSEGIQDWKSEKNRTGLGNAGERKRKIRNIRKNFLEGFADKYSVLTSL